MSESDPAAPHGRNELCVVGARYLLVGVTSRHLAAPAGVDEQGRGVLAEWRTGTEPWAAAYDMDSLLDPIWSPHTLCGLEWIEMEPGDGPPFERLRTGSYAPDCKNCLRIISSELESVPPDERVPLIVGLVVTEVLAEAGTVVTGVPGEQLETLRAAIRRRFRSLGITCRTYPMGGDLHVISDELWDHMPADRKAKMESQAATAIADAIQGISVPNRGIAWGTSGVV